jgi:type II secretory ATPase GspE/PulE/Tfp pilus assembly ATPase PilB-like protein
MLQNLKMEMKGRKKLYRAKGCDACLNTGYRGRVGLFELLTLNDAISEAILERKGEAELTVLSRDSGFASLLANATTKLTAGLTSPEEVPDTLTLEE